MSNTPTVLAAYPLPSGQRLILARNDGALTKLLDIPAPDTSGTPLLIDPDISEFAESETVALIREYVADAQRRGVPPITLRRNE